MAPTPPKTSSRQNNVCVYLVTLGCAKNLVDAEVMCGTLAANGIHVTTDRSQANVTIVNTCCFIDDAKAEALKAIEDALRWKKHAPRRGRRRLVLVGGCLAQRYSAELVEKYPDVDGFLGIDEVPKVAAIIQELLKKEPAAAGADLVSTARPTYLYDEQTPRLLSTKCHAYVKIAEGCNHRCSYCIIPSIRGNMRSRTESSILAECRNLLKSGVRELILIAQDSSAYGKDLQGEEKTSLAHLLKQLNEWDGTFWVRVLYTHPKNITDELLDILSAGGHVVPYLDLPIQHISDSILASMGRGMTGAETRALLQHIREKYPRLFIRTTLIVGYPGETKEKYLELKQFVKDFGFDRLGVFTFSPQSETPAAKLSCGVVPPATAESRRQEIMALQETLSRKRNSALIGKKLPVLIETSSRLGVGRGRTEGDAPEVDQEVLLVAPTTATRKLFQQGSIVLAEVKSATSYQLRAHLVSPRFLKKQ